MPSTRKERVSARRRVRFLAHEIAEYVLAAALLAVGIHTSGATQLTLVAVGAVLLLLNLVTAGTLGAFSVLGRRAHHAGDVLVIVALVLSPLVAYRHLHVLGVVVAEAVALVLIRIERTTAYVDVPRPVREASDQASPGGGTGTAPPVGSRRNGDVSSAVNATAALAGALMPVAGRAAGRAAKTGAHRLGLITGAGRRVARERAAARRAGSGGAAG